MTLGLGPCCAALLGIEVAASDDAANCLRVIMKEKLSSAC
jgi:hypothetical protein